MDKCSYFIKSIALFGSFPSQDTVYRLEQEGVVVFVNLTSSTEYGIVPYKTNCRVVNYPMPDNGVPKNKITFTKFILYISKIIRMLAQGEKIYIHCRGGHGRSGIVVASLLAVYHNISADEALEKTKLYHQHRITMRDKWRLIGSPQTLEQKEFVKMLFRPIVVSESDQIETIGLRTIVGCTPVDNQTKIDILLNKIQISSIQNQ